MGRMLPTTGREGRRTLRLVLLTLGVVVAAGALAAGTAAAARPHRPYLSLGDSLAFGYQPDLFAAHDYDPGDYRSYAERFARIRPRLRLTNLGCPGETTDTLIGGGCPWTAGGLSLHSPYPPGDSQLAAAVAFLHAHPRTALITLDVGSNDLLAVLRQCDDNLVCVEGALPQALLRLRANYATILTALRAAAPRARLVLLNLYNPFAVALPGSDQLLESVNTVIAGLASAYGARVADAFHAINRSPGSPLEALSVCALTWECTRYRNVHPTGLGYWSLTLALVRATR